jgi:hypothetical protein
MMKNKAVDSLVKIFREILDDTLNEALMLSVVYILTNYIIYFDPEEAADADDYGLELTMRSAAAVTRYIETGVDNEEDYMSWLNKYRDEFPNPNEIPGKYVSVVEELLQRLKAHKSVNRVVKNV